MTKHLAVVAGGGGAIGGHLAVSKIARVASDAPLRAELSARGRARAAGFSWERAARETLAIYRRVLGGVGPNNCRDGVGSPSSG